jgi:phage terminase large subunit GpA-like protein
MSEYYSYGDFCKDDLQIKSDIPEHRHHIPCPKCDKTLKPSFNENSRNYYCKCQCADNMYYSCTCGNTFIKKFECIANKHN